MRRHKITVVGAGRVGETTAHLLAEKGLGDVVLIDVVEHLAAGKALDLLESRPVDGFDVEVLGTHDFEQTTASDLVIVTAGLPRKPGMSRDDLIYANLEIVKSVVQQVAPRSPDALLMIISNPLDVMCDVARTVSGFEPTRVFGMAGVLDSARFRTFLAAELNVSVKDVAAFVLGGHGDEMVPLIRSCTIGGIPITELLSTERIDAIVKRTQGAGGEIVKLLGFSAYFSPAHSAVAMASAVLRDERRILPCSAWLTGQYGTSDHYLGVPCLLGRNGVERVFEMQLNDTEKVLLQKSIDGVKATTAIARARL